MSGRPLLLDAFSCAGLIADGYAEHFDVVCLDSDERALSHNPHHVVCGDAMRLLDDPGFMRQFAAVHASPPCQGYSSTRHLAAAQGKGGGKRTERLLEPVRRLLEAWGGPWVMENVPRSPLKAWPGVVRVCGSSFGLKAQRHRLFAPSSDVELVGTPCDHAVFDLDPITWKPRPWGVYYAMGDSIPSGGRTATSWEHACSLLDVPTDRLPYRVKGEQTAAWRHLCEGLPPVYGRHIGAQLRAAVDGGPAPEPSCDRCLGSGWVETTTIERCPCGR